MEEDKATPSEPQQEPISSPEPQLPASLIHKDPTQEKTVVITTQSEPIILGRDPSTVLCPFCHVPIVTTVKSEPTTKTHLLAAVLCCLGGLMCVWIPYCMESCQGQSHYCPNCNAYLGKYEK